MVMIDKNFYVIKQSDGTTWKFSFNNAEGIIYKLFKENTWSEYHVHTKEALKNFSVILLPDDSINVLCQDLTGTLILGKYDGKQWNKQEILTNEKNHIFDIYFKTITNEKKIHMIFSIFNKENNIATLFHQILDENNNLSKSKVIDRIKYDYDVPFVLYSPDNRDLFIMYQRFVNNHELGYKSFNKNNEKWSDFKLIDRSKYPFKDYSAIIFNDILHGLYIKKEGNIGILNYVYGNHFNFKNTKLFKGPNIESCLLFIIYGQIWCFGIEKNKIYSSFSIDNGSNFTTPPYEQLIDSTDIFKSIYISNEPKERKGILCNEIYLTNDDVLQHFIFSTLYPPIKNDEKSNGCQSLSFIEYYMTEICLKVLSYEKTSRRKEQLIFQLKHKLEEQKAQTLFYEIKFKEINKAYTKFIDLKNQLNENVNLLQQSLTDKEEKLILLENLNMTKQKEMISLKEALSRNVNLLEQSLANKEEKLTLLENRNMEKEKEILSLKENFSQNVNLLQQSLADKEEKLTLLEGLNIKKEKEILYLKTKPSQNANLLQKCLTDRDEKLALLENINMAKQKEILFFKEKIKILEHINIEKEKEKISLNKKLSQYENIILFLMHQIKILRRKFRIMSTKRYKKHNMN